MVVLRPLDDLDVLYLANVALMCFLVLRKPLHREEVEEEEENKYDAEEGGGGAVGGGAEGGG